MELNIKYWYIIWNNVYSSFSLQMFPGSLYRISVSSCERIDEVSAMFNVHVYISVVVKVSVAPL